MKKTFYITTAIDYVNARPHIGHAFEKVLADALARHKRQKSYDVFFLTGVDENAQKNVQAAEAAGIPIKKFVDKNTGFFVELVKKLNISHDKFIRTTDEYHMEAVKKIFKRLYDQGDIYKSEYEGLYCTPCESFWTETQLVDGKCPDCGRPVEKTKEESYFFNIYEFLTKIIIKGFFCPRRGYLEFLVL